jgi:DNA-binding transcriptional LysR family regulator
VRIELLLLDRVVNLLEEDIDLAVRIGALADSSMIATRVGWMRRVVVASPELLARTGEPSHPQELAGHACVQFRGLGAGGSWHFREQTREISVAVNGVLTTNQAIPAVEACVAGLGFGRFLAYQVEPRVKAGRLRIVLPAFEPPPAPVSLVYTEARLMSPRLRVLLDFMKLRLRKALGEARPEQDLS